MATIKKQKDFLGRDTGSFTMENDDGSTTSGRVERHLFDDGFTTRNEDGSYSSTQVTTDRSGNKVYITHHSDGTVERTVGTGNGEYVSRHSNGSVTRYRDTGYGTIDVTTTGDYDDDFEEFPMSPYALEQIGKRLAEEEERRRMMRIPHLVALSVGFGLLLLFSTLLAGVFIIADYTDPETILSKTHDLSKYLGYYFGFAGFGVACSFFLSFSADHLFFDGRFLRSYYDLFYDMFYFPKNLEQSESAENGNDLKIAEQKQRNTKRKIFFFVRILLGMVLAVVCDFLVLHKTWTIIGLMLPECVFFFLMLCLPVPSFYKETKDK